MYKKVGKNKYLVYALLFLLLNMIISPSYYHAHATSKTWVATKNDNFYSEENKSISNERSKSKAELLEEKMKELLTYLEENDSKSSSKGKLKKIAEEIKR